MTPSCSSSATARSEAARATETINFAAQWRERHPDWRIEVCFIEHADVLLDEGLDRAAQGAKEGAHPALILNAAGHVKMELPARIEAARERHPTSSSWSPAPRHGGSRIFAVLKASLTA